MKLIVKFALLILLIAGCGCEKTSQPVSMVGELKLGTYLQEIILDGNFAYASDGYKWQIPDQKQGHVYRVDISDRKHPSLSLTKPISGFLAAQNQDFLFVFQGNPATNQNQRIVILSKPNLNEAGIINLPDGLKVADIFVRENIICISGNHILIFDISNLDIRQIFKLNGDDLPSEDLLCPRKITAADNKIYVADNCTGNIFQFQINPDGVAYLGFIKATGGSATIGSFGGYMESEAMEARNDSLLFILHYTFHTAWVDLKIVEADSGETQFEKSYGLAHVRAAIENSKLYLVLQDFGDSLSNDPKGRLVVLDISDPVKPAEIRDVPFEMVRGIVIQDGVIYAIQEDQLKIFELH